MTRAIPVATALLMFVAAAGAQGQTPPAAGASTAPEAEAPAQVRGSSMGQQEQLVPGMFGSTTEVLYSDHVWTRPNLSPRDRSLVTIAVLIATDKPGQLRGHIGRALDNGVLPSEAAGVLTHMAIYAGWPAAVVALDVYDEVFTTRDVDTAPLRAAAAPLPIVADDAERARALDEQLGTIAPKFTELTNDVVFGNLWRRSELSVRDRSLVTLAALAAMGDDDQLDFYLRRAVDSGLSSDQIAEAFTQVAFYAGWPKATKAQAAAARVMGPASR